MIRDVEEDLNSKCGQGRVSLGTGIKRSKKNNEFIFRNGQKQTDRTNRSNAKMSDQPSQVTAMGNVQRSGLIVIRTAFGQEQVPGQTPAFLRQRSLPGPYGENGPSCIPMNGTTSIQDARGPGILKWRNWSIVGQHQQRDTSAKRSGREWQTRKGFRHQKDG